MSSFGGENMQTQYNVIGLTCIFMTISLRQKSMKMDTVTEILTTKYKDKKKQNKNLSLLELTLTKDTLIFLKLSIRYLDIKQSTKKTLTSKISTRLLEKELKSDIIIKPKAINFIVKKILLVISNNGSVLHQL